MNQPTELRPTRPIETRNRRTRRQTTAQVDRLTALLTAVPGKPTAAATAVIVLKLIAPRQPARTGQNTSNAWTAGLLNLPMGPPSRAGNCVRYARIAASLAVASSPVRRTTSADWR